MLHVKSSIYTLVQCYIHHHSPAKNKKEQVQFTDVDSQLAMYV